MAETIKHADPCFYLISYGGKDLLDVKYQTLVDEVFQNDKRLILLKPEYLQPRGRC